MKYTDGYNKIESPFNWIKNIFETVFNGENTTKENFYKGSFEDLINTQNGNYNNCYGTNYYLTEKQKAILKKRWIKLKEVFEE